MPADGSRIYLTDTLESPNTPSPTLPLFLKPIAEQHAKALKVKSKVPVIVCLGNPPYDRHQAADETNKARTGSWVRWGEDGKGTAAIFADFTKPVKLAGHGGDLKNIYNLYAYFWRWALWKVFENSTAVGPGVISFTSASSYLDGDAFCGMRKHMRELCDEIWILDLGGEGRGTRKSENVFAIQTPVAIAVAVSYGKAKKHKPAKVHYSEILDGTHEEKLQTLDAIADFTSLSWQDCPNDWLLPFRPAGKGTYFGWPLLTDILPWQQSGIKAGRTWVIAPSRSELCERWRVLSHADEHKRATLFKNSPTGRKTTDSPTQLPPGEQKLKPINEISSHTSPPDTIRYAYRSFDRQYIFADARLLDRPSPSLWAAHSNEQVYLTTLLKHPLGGGAAITAAADIPDLHHFRGSYGAKAVIPLYRDVARNEPNVLPGLLNVLSVTYGRKVVAEDFLAYVYGILAQPAFTKQFVDELGLCELRVPLTKDANLFAQVASVGTKLLWLHTYCQRLVPKGKHIGQVPRGAAKCKKTVPTDATKYPEEYRYNEETKTLHVGTGEFAPLAQKHTSLRYPA